VALHLPVIGMFYTGMNRMKCFKVALAGLTLLGFSQFSYATSTNVVDCSTKSGSYDYGNASSQESSACHSTDRWQKLGSQWTSESSNDASEQNSGTNDGVSWVTSSDGGATWIQNGELTTGGLVRFQFDVTRSTDGNHKYDQLKSWVDWNQDGSWSENETIIAEKWWKNVDSEGNVATSGNTNWDLTRWNDLGTLGSVNRDGNTWNADDNRWNKKIKNSADTSATFFSAELRVPVLNALKDIWLRARIVCENSLENHADNMNLIATGFQDQGEVEDYSLTIATVDIPEPSTLLIFLLGLLIFITQRNNKIAK